MLCQLSYDHHKCLVLTKAGAKVLLFFDICKYLSKKMQKNAKTAGLFEMRAPERRCDILPKVPYSLVEALVGLLTFQAAKGLDVRA